MKRLFTIIVFSFLVVCSALAQTNQTVLSLSHQALVSSGGEGYSIGNPFTTVHHIHIGCTDENACNYDANALQDIGSCEYAADFRSYQLRS